MATPEHRRIFCSVATPKGFLPASAFYALLGIYPQLVIARYPCFFLAVPFLASPYWILGETNEMEITETTEPLFVILDVPNKGQSVFATRFIPAGTPLFQEPPIITVSNAHATAKIDLLNRAFSLLPTEKKIAYLSLCNSQVASDTLISEKDIAVLGIWKTNTFVLDEEGVVNGIFQVASRLNHSCRGGENARWEWSEEEGLMKFWTDQDIEVGKFFGPIHNMSL